MEPCFEEPEREDERVFFEREELLVDPCFEREFEFDDLDFDELPRFEPPPDCLLFDRELDFLVLAILASLNH